MHYRPQLARENLRPTIRVCTANACQVYLVYIKLYLASKGELVGTIRKYFKTMKECLDAREEAIKLILQSNEDKKYYYVDGGCSIAGYVTDEEWNRISSEQEKNGEYWPPGNDKRSISSSNSLFPPCNVDVKVHLRLTET